MSFFDDFPGRVEQPLPLVEPQHGIGMVGGFVPWRIVLARTEIAYAALQGFEAFPSGVQFALVERFRNEIDPVDRTPFGIDPRALRIGVQFSDGRSGATQLFTGRARPLRSGEVLIGSRGGSGHRGEQHMNMWLGPLPPPGPMQWFSVWPEMGITEHSVEADASELVSAAMAAQRLWPDD
ncbi:MAG: hypothetical protein M0007_01790 [Actinomycetota bacterium]|nr:hypothetical protein [Actinomycetota bacterium]